MPPPHFPWYKRLLSYVYPVRVKEAVGIGQKLEIYMYCGQWQLATADALYSDGNRYRPVIFAFKKLKHKLPGFKKVLVLGTGLGSAVKILNNKGYYPQVTLVDIDKQVLKWAIEYSEEDAVRYITPVCMDANIFVAAATETYDLIFIDIFKGRDVPAFVSSMAFLEHSRRLLNAGGCVVWNYIINNQGEWQATKNTFDHVFPGNEVINMDVNRIFVAGV